jgi:hypothetical protein
VAAITKNVPLVTTIGFEIASEAGAQGRAAAPLTSSAERLGSLEKANSEKGVAAQAAPAADESKSKKTFITDYDIIETLGEGSFGAVREREKGETEKKVFFFFFFFSLFVLPIAYRSCRLCTRKRNKRVPLRF